LPPRHCVSTEGMSTVHRLGEFVFFDSEKVKEEAAKKRNTAQI
jgi:hypothetical protein